MIRIPLSYELHMFYTKKDINGEYRDFNVVLSYNFQIRRWTLIDNDTLIHHESEGPTFNPEDHVDDLVSDTSFRERARRWVKKHFPAPYLTFGPTILEYLVTNGVRVAVVRDSFRGWKFCGKVCRHIWRGAEPYSVGAEVLEPGDVEAMSEKLFGQLPHGVYTFRRFMSGSLSAGMVIPLTVTDLTHHDGTPLYGTGFSRRSKKMLKENPLSVKGYVYWCHDNNFYRGWLTIQEMDNDLRTPPRYWVFCQAHNIEKPERIFNAIDARNVIVDDSGGTTVNQWPRPSEVKDISDILCAVSHDFLLYFE